MREDGVLPRFLAVSEVDKNFEKNWKNFQKTIDKTIVDVYNI